ncbi:MAG: hypothetical protein JNK11_00340 [Alphaproteobacteria bacterium]|nr:hypothetical protein [Alphaproteobacteria bacterium]
MSERHWETGRPLEALRAAGSAYEAEYAALHGQRIALIRQYNMWYAIGFATSLSCFWLLVFLSLSVSSMPLMIASAAIASCIVWFAYRVVLTIDRHVVALYPRIVFLELALDLDFYRDYLRRRPRGDTERSFIERCEQVAAGTTVALWREVYSLFNAKDFPSDRRITVHFKYAGFLAVAMYWLIVGLIVLPQYLGRGR